MSKQVLLLLILCAIIIFIWYKTDDTVKVKSLVDGNTYMIRRGRSKSRTYLQYSADTLAQINARVEKLISHLVDEYRNDDDFSHIVDKLKENYKHNILSEAAIDKRYTTYTVDKSSMHICLRTRDAQERLYDMNTLMYVVLHELAHLCNYTKSGSPIVGHGEEFKMIFYKLVKVAVQIGIYVPRDYSQTPVEYCGMMISSNIYIS